MDEPTRYDTHQPRYAAAFDRLVNAYRLTPSEQKRFAADIAAVHDEAVRERQMALAWPGEMIDELCGTVEDNAREVARGDTT